MQFVGKEVIRVDGRQKVTGDAKFVEDYYFPDMYHVAVVRSNVAHAKIKKIITDKALSLDKSIKVFTPKDIPGKNAYGYPIEDNQFLAYDKVRYIGDAIAVVIAKNKQLAKKAAELVQVEYEPLEGVFSPFEALKDKIKVHDRKSNKFASFKIRKSDINKAFKEADIKLEATFKTQHIEHSYIEVEGALSVFDGEKLLIFANMQSPIIARNIIASAFNLPIDKVRIIQANVGGSFGGKDDVVYEAILFTSLASYYTKKPAKYIPTREESFISSYKRHAFESKYKIAATKDGKLKGIKMDIVSDGGAYASVGPFVLWRNIVHAAGPYKWEAVHLDSAMVYTNNVYQGAMRGFGAPQANFAYESIIDELSYKLNMDPIDLRLKNILDKGSTTATGQKLENYVPLKDILNRIKKVSLWDKKRKEYEEFNKRDYFIKKGIGVSVVYHGISLGAEGKDFAESEYVITPEKVVVSVGTTDFGQGSRTGYAQIAAEMLGIDIEDIQLINYDTKYMLDSGPTVASRGTTVGGKAVYLAGKKITKKLEKLFNKVYKVEGVRYEKGYFIDKNSKKIMSLFEFARIYQKPIKQRAKYNVPDFIWDDETGQGTPYLAYHYAAQVADLDVDIQTGQVFVNRYYAIHDVGKAINPQMVKGQIYGGIVQGLGYALMEDLDISKGVIHNKNFDNYIIPTALDIPDIYIEIVESEDNNIGPFSAKGVGEPPLVPVAAAVCNAIRFATGKRIYQLPASLEMVLLGRRLSKYE